MAVSPAAQAGEFFNTIREEQTPSTSEAGGLTCLITLDCKTALIPPWRQLSSDFIRIGLAVKLQTGALPLDPHNTTWDLQVFPN